MVSKGAQATAAIAEVPVHLAVPVVQLWERAVVVTALADQCLAHPEWDQRQEWDQVQDRADPASAREVWLAEILVAWQEEIPEVWLVETPVA